MVIISYFVRRYDKSRFSAWAPIIISEFNPLARMAYLKLKHIPNTINANKNQISRFVVILI